MNWRYSCEVILFWREVKWSEVSYGGVLTSRSLDMEISRTIYKLVVQFPAGAREFPPPWRVPTVPSHWRSSSLIGEDCVILKVKAADPFETSVNILQSIRRNIPENMYLCHTIPQRTKTSKISRKVISWEGQHNVTKLYKYVYVGSVVIWQTGRRVQEERSTAEPWM